MITREEARQYALKTINEYILESGEDFIGMKSPQPGKNTWTLGEMKKSVESDTNLENGGSLIDNVLEYEKWLNDRGKSLKDREK